ncbi:Plasmodium exported protein, unknown function [Plasmodium gonderi]|uniref:Plasmodium RESA N-terminal domain-containing protein n=1 Tax=Plasmodium gonderi TaxID=77519 RepID=A0A1Y1JFT3_PLAGO|nr:Plasmodium exported protein, unknown function [Plasmodium gonderi]GAW80077.1 Plasmodium exported protein, unknown function [Plasmodium gonderi]
MTRSKSRINNNSSGDYEYNIENKSFTKCSIPNNKAFFFIQLSAFLYILLLNIFINQSNNNDHRAHNLPSNHRHPRSLAQRTMLTLRGTVVNQNILTKESGKNRNPLPEETVEDYLSRLSSQVELTNQLICKIQSYGPDISLKDMNFIYMILYNEHKSNWSNLLECLKNVSLMLATKYGRNASFQKKVWCSVYKKLTQDVIRESDNDGYQNLKKFLKKQTSCKTCDFIKFLNSCITSWNDFATKKKNEAYTLLCTASKSGTIESKK